MFFLFFFCLFFYEILRILCCVFGLLVSALCRGHRDRARVIVGFTTTCAISAYHH